MSHNDHDPSSIAPPPPPSSSDDDSSTDGSASPSPPPRPRSTSLSGGDVRAPSPSMARRSGTPMTPGGSPRRSLSFDETAGVDVSVAGSTVARPSSRPRSNSRRQHTPTEGSGRGRYESPLSPMPNRYNIHQLDPEVDPRQQQDEATLDAEERLTREIARRVALADATRRSPTSATTTSTGGRALTAGYAIGEATAGATLHERLHRQRQRRQQQDLAPIDSAPRRSDKQSRPSRRKMRRWDNDAMVGVAAEIARAGSSKGDAARGARMAEAFARGEADAVHFLRANHPREYRSVFASMVDEDRDGNSKMTHVKERFVRGEVSGPTSVDRAHDRRRRTRRGRDERDDAFSDGSVMFRRIEPRLRKILVRTCGADNDTSGQSNGNVGTAGRVVRLLDAFEVYLISKFRSGSIGKVSTASEDGEEEGGFVVVSAKCEEKEKDWLANVNKVEREALSVLGEILLQTPTVQLSGSAPSPNNNNNKKGGSGGARGVQFLFDPTTSQGGFHRLLLHAVCQFHGLQATSVSVRDVSGDVRGKGGEIGAVAARTRSLVVTGRFRGAKFRLVDFASTASSQDARRGTDCLFPALISSENEPPGRCREKSTSASNESLVGSSSVGCITESMASMQVS